MMSAAKTLYKKKMACKPTQVC